MQRSNLFNVLFCVQIFIFIQNITAEESNAYNETVRNRLRQIFHTPDGSIPEFEVVNIRVSKGPQKRDVHKNESGIYFQTLAFGEQINLWLHPPSDMVASYDTPVYYASYSAEAPGNIRYTKRNRLMEALGDLYEDPGTWTSLVFSGDEESEYRVDGYVGSLNAGIISLPCGVVENLLKPYQSGENPSSPSNNSHCHVFYRAGPKRESNGNSIISAYNDLPPDINITSYPDVLPDTLYPEILAVVDLSTYEYLSDAPDDTAIMNFLKYSVTLWNGVSLKYRSLTNPAVRLSVSAIVFAMEPNATPYIFNNLISSVGFNATAALLNSSRTYYDVRETFPFSSYDVVMTMTRRQLVPTPETAPPDLGISIYKGVCLVDPKKQRVYSTSIFHDNGVFSGIHNAAHELGHLLGANHEFPIRYCYPALGYIMASPILQTENSADFSKCSRVVFENRFRQRKFECLYNRPRGRKMPYFMPGKIMDLHAQCQAYGFSRSCSNDASVCAKLSCIKGEDVCVRIGRAALDGTPCSPLSSDWFCLHMECITLTSRRKKPTD